MIEPCKACFIAQISNCQEQVVLDLGLAVDLDVKWQLTTRLGNIFTGTATVDSSEILTIPADAAELPEGLFTPYQGTYKLELFDAEDDSIIHYVIDDVDYDCIQFTVAAGTLVNSTIPSPNRVVSSASSSGNNYLIID